LDEACLSQTSKKERYKPGEKRVSSWRKCAEELSQGKRSIKQLGYTQDSGSDIDSAAIKMEGFALTELKNSIDSNSYQEDLTH
jgi:hypothetical protein